MEKKERERRERRVARHGAIVKTEIETDIRDRKINKGTEKF